MKRLFAVLLALAVMWPQIIFPCPREATACSTVCAKCACSMVCCDSGDSAEAEPLALPAQDVFSSPQWAVPQTELVIIVPVAKDFSGSPGVPAGFSSRTPLFLRDCAQLI